MRGGEGGTPASSSTARIASAGDDPWVLRQRRPGAGTGRPKRRHRRKQFRPTSRSGPSQSASVTGLSGTVGTALPLGAQSTSVGAGVAPNPNKKEGEHRAHHQPRRPHRGARHALRCTRRETSHRRSRPRPHPRLERLSAHVATHRPRRRRPQGAPDRPARPHQNHLMNEAPTGAEYAGWPTAAELIAEERTTR
jgi:hypothetical protein